MLLDSSFITSHESLRKDAAERARAAQVELEQTQRALREAEEGLAQEQEKLQRETHRARHLEEVVEGLRGDVDAFVAHIQVVEGDLAKARARKEPLLPPLTPESPHGERYGGWHACHPPVGPSLLLSWHGRRNGRRGKSKRRR